MSTGAIVAIVVGVLILIALAYVLSRAATNRRMEQRREEAGELRTQARERELAAQRHQADAEEREAIADRAEAEAREQAAIAKRERAAAEERAAHADRESRMAHEHTERATELDPDAEDDDDRWARDQEAERRV